MQLLFAFVYFFHFKYIFHTFQKNSLHIGINKLIIVNGCLYLTVFQGYEYNKEN